MKRECVCQDIVQECIVHKLVADFSEEIIPASGGVSIIKGLYLTYNNTMLIDCKIITPIITLVAADRGLCLDGDVVRAENRGQVEGGALSLIIKLTYEDAFCTGEILQQANAEHAEKFQIMVSHETFDRDGGQVDLYGQMFVSYTSGAKGLVVKNNTLFSVAGNPLLDDSLSVEPLCNTGSKRVYLVQGSVECGGRMWLAEKKITQSSKTSM